MNIQEYDISAVKEYLNNKFYDNKLLYLHLEEILPEFPIQFGDKKIINDRLEFVHIMDYLTATGFIKEVRLIGYFDDPCPKFDFLFSLGSTSIELVDNAAQ